MNDERRHSEVDAILKLKYRRDKLKKPIKIAALVIRVTATGALGMSRPCMHCIFALNRLPERMGYIITEVYYSDKNGEIIKTTMGALLVGHQHVSRGHR